MYRGKNTLGSRCSMCKGPETEINLASSRKRKGPGRLWCRERQTGTHAGGQEKGLGPTLVGRLW